MNYDELQGYLSRYPVDFLVVSLPDLLLGIVLHGKLFIT